MEESRFARDGRRLREREREREREKGGEGGKETDDGSAEITLNTVLIIRT
jgi:hypothetical protein